MNSQERMISAAQRGFTLIEVMVALVVLAIGLLAVAGMQVISIQSNTGNRDVTEASTLALDKIEFLKVLPVDDDRLKDTEMVEQDDGSYEEEEVEHSESVGKYTVSWDVTDNEDTKQIAVRVDWTSGQKQRAKNVELATLILDK